DLTRLPIRDVLTHVSSLPEHTFIIQSSFQVDASGERFYGIDLVPYVSKAANRPLFTPIDLALGHGVVGGVTVGFEDMGRDAGRMATPLLRCQPSPPAPVPSFATSVPRFDGRQLARWHLDERRLPEGSEVIFHEATFWQEYRRYVAGAVAVIGAQAALIGALVAQRRRRREVQATLQRVEAAAQRQLNQIAHLDRVAAMGQLASSMAHELNQPLAGILANAQAMRLLLADSLPDLDELQACLADIISDDKRASEVIRHMRSLLKKTGSVFVPFALNELAANTIRLVANEALLHEVTIDFLAAPELPVAHGDTVQIQQVILNLLTNAITAAANRGGGPTGMVTVWTAVAPAPYVELGV